MNITNEMINEIRNKLDIVEIISNYLPLTQRGKNYFGVCPFHDDHSPSMSVSKEKQIYTCFSCGASGNVFTFVSDYEHIGFYDAVRLLGKKVGYDLGGIGNKVNNKYDNYYEIYEYATKFYQNNLNTELGINAKEYLDKRKIDKETIKKFKIGLSLNKSILTDYLINKKYNLKDLVDIGISNDNGSDLFINRIIFPLFDLEGKIVGFSGRIYNTKDNHKYINTKETVIFKKGNILYNYHNAKEHLKKNDTIIVMEGFMDVIRANTIGLTNCVATMGTALTKQNALLLKKSANNIILCFDGDEAGKEASNSAIKVFREIDVIPKIVRLDEGLDPDEYILKYGKDAFLNRINNPDSMINFLMEIHKENKNLMDISDITKYVDEALKELIYIEDEIEMELTLKKLSDNYKINYNTLKDKFVGLKNNKNIELKIDIPQDKKLNQYDSAVKGLIYYMLNDVDIIKKVEKELRFINKKESRILVNEIICFYNTYRVFRIADFISFIADKEEIYNELKDVMKFQVLTENKNEEIDNYLEVINKYPVDNKIKELELEMRNANDVTKKLELLNEIVLLKGVKQ